MKKWFDKGKGGYFNRKWIFVAVGIVVVGLVLVFLLFHYRGCDDWECFNSGLRSCSRVRFIGGSEMIFEYKVKGSNNDGCEVDVTLLQGELDNEDSIKLEGYDMSCVLPKGVVMAPESDIGNCHGLLKEGLQDLVITRLQAYLVQNLGRINLELIDVEEFMSE